MFNVDKMNDALRAGLKNPAKQEIVDKSFEVMANFTNTHGNKEWAECQEGTTTPLLTRSDVLGMMNDDMHRQVCQPQNK
jgi:hypothetical protein